jgi:hypothetical protein
LVELVELPVVPTRTLLERLVQQTQVMVVAVHLQRTRAVKSTVVLEALV